MSHRILNILIILDLWSFLLQSVHILTHHISSSPAINSELTSLSEHTPFIWKSLRFEIITVSLHWVEFEEVLHAFSLCVHSVDVIIIYVEFLSYLALLQWWFYLISSCKIVSIFKNCGTLSSAQFDSIVLFELIEQLLFWSKTVLVAWQIIIWSLWNHVWVGYKCVILWIHMIVISRKDLSFESSMRSDWFMQYSSIILTFFTLQWNIFIVCVISLHIMFLKPVILLLELLHPVDCCLVFLDLFNNIQSICSFRSFLLSVFALF